MERKQTQPENGTCNYALDFKMKWNWIYYIFIEYWK